MKFGQQLESESVPEWSLHNIDYNTLKEYIKVHTTRDQATAITIPGQTDTALQRFENDFYEELCRQHDRVGLFVATKADEISRRLQHISDQIHRLLLRGTTSARGTAAFKRQRRFAKCERSVLQLHDEIKDLSRFVNAQIVAFRKILKKYKKWTGSGTLTFRFRDNVLSDPKSFTRRDFGHLESHCDELLVTLRAATPISSTPQSPREELLNADYPDIPSCRPGNGHVHSSSSSTIQALSSSAGSTQPRPRPQPEQARRVTVVEAVPVQTHYWNEYDDGSEAGDISGQGSGGYAIYLHPDEESEFPGMATLVSIFTIPLEKAKKWMASRGARSDEDGPLLSQDGRGLSMYGTTGVGGQDGGLFASLAQHGHGPTSEADGQHQAPEAAVVDFAPASVDNYDEHDSTEEDDAFASDSDFPQGYETHYATLPSINDQRISRYRDTMLLRGTIGCFAAALVLLGVASILISTGKHKRRVEVDAGVIMGVVASLGFACAALGMSMARQSNARIASQVAVWVSFAAICCLNGAVLVLVMGNTVITN